MGLFSFIKDAGAKLFSSGDSKEEQAAKVVNEFKKYNFGVGINCIVEGSTVTLSGEVSDLNEKLKVLTTAGNIEGVEKVVDQLTVAQGEEVPVETNFYDVKPGDNLSKIAKEMYGDPNKYPVIFEANKPMLKHPDKIYVGQKLVIPSI
jgi:nucleoid-associated protein YgaU